MTEEGKWISNVPRCHSDWRTVEFTRQRVYEPHLGEPAATDPLEVEIVEKTRGRLITSSVFYAFPVALAVLFRLTGPAVWTVTAVFTALAALSVWTLACRTRPLGRLLRMPAVVLTPGPGHLLVSGRTVSIALPGPQPRWVVARMPRSKRLLLARERRVFMLGPDARGRLVLRVPGSIIGQFGRVRTAPAPGSRAPDEVAPDAVVIAFVRELRLRAALVSTAFLVAGAFVWVLTEAGAEAFGFPRPNGVTAVVCVAYALLGVARPLQVRSIARAARTQPWTELGVTLDTPVEPHATGTGNTMGRATLPDGRVARVRFGRQPLDLLVNVRETQRLWVLGAPERGRKLAAGVPGHPVLGQVRLD